MTVDELRRALEGVRGGVEVVRREAGNLWVQVERIRAAHLCHSPDDFESVGHECGPADTGAKPYFVID
jgi:hypothetical protein